MCNSYPYNALDLDQIDTKFYRSILDIFRMLLYCIPEQSSPFPINPKLHVHTKVPKVFWQVALVWQGLSSHTFTSKNCGERTNLKTWCLNLTLTIKKTDINYSPKENQLYILCVLNTCTCKSVSCKSCVARTGKIFKSIITRCIWMTRIVEAFIHF